MSDSARKAAEEIREAVVALSWAHDGDFVPSVAAIIAKHFSPAPIPAMGEREAFEAWLPKHKSVLIRSDDNSYRYDDIQLCWEAWQAALSTPSPSPSEGLTEEERQLLVGALNSAEQLMLNGDEYSRGRARDLVIGVRRKLDRLVKEGK